jgi:hypothetical protein
MPTTEFYSTEEVKQINKKYYYANRDKILNYHNQIYECPCGKQITRGAVSTHHKSKIHQKFLNRDINS